MEGYHFMLSQCAGFSIKEDTKFSKLTHTLYGFKSIPEPVCYGAAMGKRAAEFLKNLLLVLASVLVSLALVEGALGLALSYPARFASADGAPSSLLLILRNYHERALRRIVQFLPECARWDAEVTYTLKPGACEVANREHKVRYAANRLGLRDTDAALEGPEIVVVGDSYAMGWGVAEDEAFPRALARGLGTSVLNAAISSYGTAREMILLERLARESGAGAAAVLVIQYSDNDYEENRAYVAAGGRLAVTPEPVYRALVERHAATTFYWPGKHVAGVAGLALVTIRRAGRPRADSAEEQARAFLDTLLVHRRQIEGRITVVLVLTSRERLESGFIARASELIAELPYRALAPALSFLDLAPLLGPQDFFVLDEHLNAEGHGKVAVALAAEIARRRASAR